MTLIEIVVVIAILTALMSAVGVYALGVHAESLRKIARTETRTAAAALEVHRALRGRYPTASEGFAAVVASRALKELPRDPWGHELTFVIENGDPIVTSLGADGQPGGEGQDADLTNRDKD